jgi:hypothetical protein
VGVNGTPENDHVLSSGVLVDLGVAARDIKSKALALGVVPGFVNRSNAHAMDASRRSGACAWIDQFSKFTFSGKKPFSVSMSNRDRWAGNRGTRQIRSGGLDAFKDAVSYEFTSADELDGEKVIKMVDVDYHLERPTLEGWMQRGVVAMYTFAPRDVAGTDGELSWKFEVDSRAPNGAWVFQGADGEYRHELWDYSGETRTSVIAGNELLRDTLYGLAAALAGATAAFARTSGTISFGVGVTCAVATVGFICGLPSSMVHKVVRIDQPVGRSLVLLIPCRTYGALYTYCNWAAVQKHRVQRLRPLVSVVGDMRVVTFEVITNAPYVSVAHHGVTTSARLTPELEATIRSTMLKARAAGKQPQLTAGFVYQQYKTDPAHATEKMSMPDLALFIASIELRGLGLPVVTAIDRELDALRVFKPAGPSEVGPSNQDEHPIKARLLFGPVICGGAYVPTRSIESYENARLYRLEKVRMPRPTQIEPIFLRYVSSFVDCWLQHMKKHGINKLTFATEEEVRNNRTRPTQVVAIDEGADLVHSTLQRKGKMVLKGETYKAAGPERIITMNDDPASNLAGAFLAYPMAKLLKTHPAYVSGLDPKQIDDRLVDTFRGYKEIIDTDFESCDGTTDARCRLMAKAVYVAVFEPELTERVEELADSMHNVKVRAPDGSFHETEDATNSGFNDTFLINSLGNHHAKYIAFIMEGMTPMQAFYAACLVSGDDGLVAGVTKHNLERAHTLCGRIIKIDVITLDDPRPIPFLGRLYSPALLYGEANSMCDLERRLRKIHVAFISEDFAIEDIIASLVHTWRLTDASTPVISQLIKKMEHVRGNVDERLIYYNARMAGLENRPNNVFEPWMAAVTAEFVTLEAYDKLIAWAEDPASDWRNPPVLLDLDVTIKKGMGPTLVDGELWNHDQTAVDPVEIVRERMVKFAGVMAELEQEPPHGDIHPRIAAAAARYAASMRRQENRCLDYESDVVVSRPAPYNSEFVAHVPRPAPAVVQANTSTSSDDESSSGDSQDQPGPATALTPTRRGKRRAAWAKRGQRGGGRAQPGN